MLATTVLRVATSAIRRWRAGSVVASARRSHRRGNTGAAIRILWAGVERYPSEAELWNELAVHEIEARDFSAAGRAVRRALELRPDLAQAHCNLGIVLIEDGEQETALCCFERALELDPGLHAARENRALLLSEIPRLEAAISAWEEIIRADPTHRKAHAMLGGILMCAGRFSEAIEWLNRVVAFAPGTPDAALYRAVIDADTSDPDRAMQAIEALRGSVKDTNLDWNLALIHLSRGDYERGWPLYESRPTRARARRRSYGFPEWQGTSAPAGSLLVIAEQGLGDEIMFGSCYPELLERVPQCVIECDPRLAALYQRSFPAAQVVGAARGNDGSWIGNYPKLQSQILAGSLPRIFRASVADFPRRIAYLHPDPRRVDAWRGQLATLRGDLKIGIAWNGGLAHTRRALRCIPLEELAGLLRGSPHSFLSLQHDDDGKEAIRLGDLSGTTVHRYPGAITDLDEQAALLGALDVVITVCSSVVHLSGAVGTRTWVLAPRVAEWRYLRSGETMPWYPAVRLFRQDRDGEWAAVIGRVADSLSALPRTSVGASHLPTGVTT
jgi:Flp pilus assembly protein TadD